MARMSSLENGDSEPFWSGLREGELRLQKCPACGATQFPPRFQCATCWHGDLQWTATSGQGVIESVTVVRRAPMAQFRDKVPYVVAAVRLDEGPRMITNIIGPDALDARIGDAVSVAFDDSTGILLAQFRRRTGGA